MMKTIENKLKVSVCVVTYNQDKYIRQCLQSIVDQRTNFDFEIIIGDDFSTDNTRAIISEFAIAYPHLITILFHKENVGAVKNYFATHDLARGMYVAHMDGDDYALPGKLEKQADFLDKNREFNIVWHRVKYEYSDGGQIDDLINFNTIKNGFYRDDLIKYTFLANHSTKMYRASQRKFCTRIDNTLDYFLNIEHLQDGKAAYVGNEILGVYRYGIGVSSNSSMKFRHYLIDGLSRIAKQKSEDTTAINCAALILMLADLKRNYITLPKTFKLWNKTLSIKSIFSYRKYLKSRKMYEIPRK